MKTLGFNVDNTMDTQQRLTDSMVDHLCAAAAGCGMLHANHAIKTEVMQKFTQRFMANGTPPLKEVTPRDKHKCTQCSFECAFPSQLEKHIKATHTQRPPPPPSVDYRCVVCSEPFVKRGSFLRHIHRKHIVMTPNFGNVLIDYPMEELERILKEPGTTDDQAKALNTLHAYVENTTKARAAMQLPAPEQLTRAHFHRAEDFAVNMKERVEKLFEELHARVQAVMKGKKDEAITKGKYYMVNVLSFCAPNNCCPKYTLYCFAYVNYWGMALIRKIRLEDTGHGGYRAVLVLNTKFVTEGPKYYIAELDRLRLELEKHKFPWTSDAKPTSFPNVMRLIALLPRRSFSQGRE